MATTETRTGFRLPWSQDHTGTDEPTGDTGETVEASESAATAAEGAAQETERPDMIDATPGVLGDTPQTAETDAPAADVTADAVAEPAHTAAPVDAPASVEAARRQEAEQADGRPGQGDADRRRGRPQGHPDEVRRRRQGPHRSRSTSTPPTEAADLRRQADDDIAGIRDWSKAEIARIREETEGRITGRKTGLDGELEDQAASTERRIARVQARVDAFEAEMAYFFEVLLAEEDPTKLAAMAQSLPEPPDFDVDVPDAPSLYAAAIESATPEPETAQVDASADPDAAFEAIAAAAHAADLAEAQAAAAAEDAASDPRLEALGLSADAAAEAEAASFEAAEAGAEQEDIPLIDDDALAAKIAGLVPDMESQPTVAKAETVSTRVVVVGLVSVASIASFKRHLGRVTGVQSVGVSSGPDGEFVFVVNHGHDVVLRDAIATLPGFGARVTGETDEGLQVTARDPEAES